MKSYTLSTEQVQMAFDVAKKIQDSKTYTKTWKTENIALGILGEIAYGLMTNQSINIDVWADKSDGGIDFQDGTDVKTVSYTGKSPELKMNKIPENIKAKKFVLAVCDVGRSPNHVHLIGEISADNFKQKATLKQYGDYFWYSVTVKDLDSIYNN